MSMDSLIPFGLQVASERLVDVGSVARGNDCNCICPSCNTPLTARQGSRNEWHFAHRSRGVHRWTTEECKHSFALSVRLMVRQLAESGIDLRVPKLIIPPQEGRYQYFEPPLSARTVTRESVVCLQGVEIDVPFCGVSVDVLGRVKGYRFAVYMTHKDRPLPWELKTPVDQDCGVIEIDLEAVVVLLRKVKSGRYREALFSYLSTEVDGKHWVYHPRERIVKARLDSDEAAVSGFEHAARLPSESKYICRICGGEWRGVSSRCERCNSHLYTSKLDN